MPVLTQAKLTKDGIGKFSKDFASYTKWIEVWTYVGKWHQAVKDLYEGLRPTGKKIVKFF